MEILHSDRVVVVPPGKAPNYNQSNSLMSLMNGVEQVQLACDREWYLRDDLQYLFAFASLSLYGPQGDSSAVTDPTKQDNKTDFQKQNVKDFTLGSTILTRGWVTTGSWTGPFLRLSYAAGPDSPLWQINHGDPGPDIRLWLKVNDRAAAAPLIVPYNGTSDRFEIELWGYAGDELRGTLRGPARDALDRGELQVRPDLLSGNPSDFDLDKVVDRDLRQTSPDCTMHPILPLHIECAWGEKSLKNWDSNGGRNYHYEFNMILRGWDHFLAESYRAADSARGSRCAADREWHSSLLACRSYVVGRLAMPPGSVVPAVPTQHPAGRSDSRRPPADMLDGAPPSTSLFAIAKNPVAGKSCHPASRRRLLGQALREICLGTSGRWAELVGPSRC
jgi:hypothetical protein